MRFREASSEEERAAEASRPGLPHGLSREPGHLGGSSLGWCLGPRSRGSQPACAPEDAPQGGQKCSGKDTGLFRWGSRARAALSASRARNPWARQQPIPTPTDRGLVGEKSAGPWGSMGAPAPVDSDQESTRQEAGLRDKQEPMGKGSGESEALCATARAWCLEARSLRPGPAASEHVPCSFRGGVEPVVLPGGAPCLWEADETTK